MTDEYASQPPISDWKFIDQLKSPLHTDIVWRRGRKKAGEVGLQDGVSLAFGFPDASGKLDTAYDDFKRFLAAGKIGVNGTYRIITGQAPTSCFEEYVLEVGAECCSILANDTEGIRRGLVFLEDQITSCGGPFVKLGQIRRTPHIKTRVSRCFFGPIKRPPMNRDELMDDVDYYPDEYLNRLVHEGINGLWLSIEFRDFPSRFFPDHGRDHEKRLEKLRRTVAQCAHYGIRVYVYCNEPVAFSSGQPYLPMSELEDNPWFKGHEAVGRTHFCTSSKEGQDYLEECTHFIFSKVPGLGGMICITNGERWTSCYCYDSLFFHNNCPRCSTRKPWEVYHDMLAAFARGMKRAAPEAEFISWLYAPSAWESDYTSTQEQKFEVYRQIAAHTPVDVTMQMNFESNGQVRQLGREFTAYDYWLSWPGPSRIFAECASNAVEKAHARASAKIQVGCSHEDATIPFMPVPSSLYRKYRAMKELGVSTVMQCWYFGNYPGLMNKAADELSFLPFADKEEEFLQRLARIDWAGNHVQVARAWKHFMRAYSNFPVTLGFSYYGPLHCSVVWPLHLVPVDQPMAPTWKFGFPDSGDRIGECVCFTHSMAEILTLLARMDANWRKGVALLASLEADYAGNTARQMDIGLCKAIGLQISSALNVFTFYDLREKLPFLEQAQQSAALKRMEDIVHQEIDNSRAMRQLCLKDPRLGFHSEAEGFKFYPAKLEWRAGLLEKLLATDLPRVAAEIEQGHVLFPAYTGVRPEGKVYACGKEPSGAAIEEFHDATGSWKAWRDATQLHLEVRCAGKPEGQEIVSLIIEPRRLAPALRLEVSSDEEKGFSYPLAFRKPVWEAAVRPDGSGWIATFSVPDKSIPWWDGHKPLRVNVCRLDAAHRYISGWVRQRPLQPRLGFGDHNSADLGWMLFPG